MSKTTLNYLYLFFQESKAILFKNGAVYIEERLSSFGGLLKSLLPGEVEQKALHLIVSPHELLKLLERNFFVLFRVKRIEQIYYFGIHFDFRHNMAVSYFHDSIDRTSHEELELVQLHYEVSIQIEHVGQV